MSGGSAAEGDVTLTKEKKLNTRLKQNQKWSQKASPRTKGYHGAKSGVVESRNVHEWCVVIGWPLSSRPASSPALDLKADVCKKRQQKETKQNIQLQKCNIYQHIYQYNTKQETTTTERRKQNSKKTQEET